MVYTATPRTPAAPNSQAGTPPPEFISSSTQTSWEACTQLCSTTAECESVYWETTTETCSLLKASTDTADRSCGHVDHIGGQKCHVDRDCQPLVCDYCP